MSEYCRLCAQSYKILKLKNILQLKSEKLDQLIFKLLKINIDELDAVTKFVCLTCIATIVQFENFTNNVQSAQETLQALRVLENETFKSELKVEGLLESNNADSWYLDDDLNQNVNDKSGKPLQSKLLSFYWNLLYANQSWVPMLRTNVVPTQLESMFI